MRGLISLALFFCAPLLARAVEFDPLAQVGRNLEQYAVIRSEFTQSKEMAALKRPLVSAGHVVYSRRDGIIWRIDRPYRATYVLGEDRIVEVDGAGLRRERNAKDVPAMAQIGTIVRALFVADAAALRKHFDVEVSGVAEKWEVDLRPRDAQVARFLRDLHLSGGRFVEAIRVGEANGDSTRIRLVKIEGSGAPNADEAVLFKVDIRKP